MHTCYEGKIALSVTITLVYVKTVYTHISHLRINEKLCPETRNAANLKFFYRVQNFVKTRRGTTGYSQQCTLWLINFWPSPMYKEVTLSNIIFIGKTL